MATQKQKADVSHCYVCSGHIREIVDKYIAVGYCSVYFIRDVLNPKNIGTLLLPISCSCRSLYFLKLHS